MSPQPVTVDATDLHALVVAFAQVDQSFGPLLGCLQGYAEARQACGRVAATLAGAMNLAAAMPPDPVASADAGAIGHHEMMLAYERAGFSHDEAFQLTLAWVQAGAAAVSERAMGGGGT